MRVDTWLPAASQPCSHYLLVYAAGRRSREGVEFALARSSLSSPEPTVSAAHRGAWLPSGRDRPGRATTGSAEHGLRRSRAGPRLCSAGRASRRARTTQPLAMRSHTFPFSKPHPKIKSNPIVDDVTRCQCVGHSDRGGGARGARVPHCRTRGALPRPALARARAALCPGRRRPGPVPSPCGWTA